uniref:Enoyl-CoA hydratase n=1 Tax=Calcidiscus leptoporus TaxID=127549 RepID=A0A7S0IHB8_9EUKA
MRARALSTAVPLHEGKAFSASVHGSRVSMTKDAKGVVTLMLRRPEKMNALDMPMFVAIADAARELIPQRDVRAVIVHGEGRAFCAGLDVKSVMSPATAAANMRKLLERPHGEVSNLAQDVGYLWRRIAAPVIAVTHGVCLGGGFQIALGADMRISAPRCKFSVMEAKWGLIPDMSATLSLPELVPKDVAMELTMTGRVFQAEEALRLGLVTTIAEDPLAEARRLADDITARSPDSTAAAKRLLHAAYASADDGRRLHLETELQRKLLGGWNQLACAAKGLGAPSMLQPGFINRNASWSEEEELDAETEIAAMLHGESAAA